MGSIIKVNEYKDFNNNDIITSDGAGVVTINAAALKSTPAFQVELASSQTVSDATWTKVAFDTEVIDTNNAFASDKFTVPSGEAGKYLIYGSIAISGSDNSSVDIGRLAPYKNGSAVIEVTVKLAISSSAPVDVDFILAFFHADPFLYIETWASSITFPVVEPTLMFV